MRRAFVRFGIAVLGALSCQPSTVDLGHNLPAVVGDASTPTAPVVDAGASSVDGAPPSLLDGGTSADPSWQWLNPRPTGNTLRAVSGLASDDVWVVGTGGSVLRWDGAAWRAVSAGAVDDDFYAVYAAGTDEAWIAGRDAAGRGKVLRWKDGRFVPDASLGDRVPFALAGTGPGDVWLLLDHGDVAHFGGTAWAIMPAPAGAGALRDVFASALDDAWIVGDGGRVAHFDGTTWTRPAVPGVTDADHDFLGVWGSRRDDVWLVYETASPSTDKQGKTGFAHWDGHALRVVQEEPSSCKWAGTGTFQTGIIYDQHGSGASTRFEAGDAPFRRGHRVWGTRSDSVLAVAGIEQCPWYWDGTRWQIDAVMQLASRTPYEREGLALWGTVPDGLWLAGASGRLLRHDASAAIIDRTVTPGAPQARYVDVFTDYREALLDVAVVPGGAWATSASHVLFFGPAGWTAVGDLYLGEPVFHALSVFSNTDVWVGAGAKLHRWNGATWSNVELPPSSSDLAYYRSIYAIWAASPNDVFVARGIDLLHFDGVAWSVIEKLPFSPSVAGQDVPLFSGVGGAGPNDVWVAAYAWAAPRSEQILYHYDGARLTEQHRSWLDEGAPYPKVWGRSPNDAWITTSPTLRWDGTSWSTPPGLAAGSTTTAVWARAADDAWLLSTATGLSPEPFTRILHWDGDAMRVTFESRPVLLAVSGDATGGWAVGQDGATLRLVAPARKPR